MACTSWQLDGARAERADREAIGEHREQRERLAPARPGAAVVDLELGEIRELDRLDHKAREDIHRNPAAHFGRHRQGRSLSQRTNVAVQPLNACRELLR